MLNSTVFKYEIPGPKSSDGITSVQLPEGSNVLYYGTQSPNPANPGDERIYLWAEVDPDGPLTRRALCVVPTGGRLPDMNHWKWVATVQFRHVNLVFHIYTLKGSYNAD